MKVVSRENINSFIKKHADAKNSLESWYYEADKAEWKTPVDMKEEICNDFFFKRKVCYFQYKRE